MEIKIKRVWSGDLERYKGVLDKLNATYKSKNYAIIEIKDLEQLFTLSKELGKDLIISHYSESKTIAIYDDYIE